MDWLVASGTISLGLLIGALVGWFVNESKIMNDRVLGTAISILSGAGVLGLLSGSRSSTREYWFYPVGLLVGFVVVTVIETWYWGYDGKKRERKQV